MVNKSLIEFLSNNDISYRINVKLNKYSYFKTGNIINILILPDSIDKIKKLITFLKTEEINYFIFGNTTNCIFRDGTNLNVVISCKKLNKIDIKSDKIIVQSGVMLPKFVLECSKRGIIGFEGLEGIPATLGGAIYMNAGAYGYSISDYIIKVKTISRDGQILEYSKKDLSLAFRESIFKNGVDDIIIEAEFAIKEQSTSKVDLIKRRIKNFKEHRIKFLEYKLPNVGSIFKTNDIYNEIAKQYFIYKLILIFMRKVIHRLIRAKDNKYLNAITFKYFNIMKYKDIVSTKTMNTVVNKNFETLIVEEYIDEIKKITNNKLELEIEIF